MSLSMPCIDTLVDLIRNKMDAMQIHDQLDLREMVILQQCLAEVQGLGDGAAVVKDFGGISQRGRRRKVGSLLGGRG